MKAVFLVLIVIISLATQTLPASACSCSAEWNIENDFEEPEAIIFSGKITNIKELQRTFRVTFEVNQSWKGIPSNVTEMTVLTSQSDASCGYHFNPNESYLVVTYGKWNETPEVTSCSSTTPLDFASSEISYLNKNTSKKPELLLENEILILLEQSVRKVYYTGKNIISVVADSEASSIIFETDKNAKLDIKAPIVYKTGPGLFTLRNGEEFDPLTKSDDCFYYASFETKESEKIEIIFASWPEYKELVENCETFTLSPLNQKKLGVSPDKVTCRENLVLVFKPSNDFPVCVKPESATKLIQRGWNPSWFGGSGEEVESKFIQTNSQATISPLEIKINSEKQVRRGTTHSIDIQVVRGDIPIAGARVFLDIEDYGENIIKESKGYTDSQGYFRFSWEIPQSFDDLKTLLAIIDVTDGKSSKTELFKFQIYCLPGEQNCKVKGN